METRLIAVLIWVICWTPSKSQSLDEKKGFSIVKLNYNLSFISDDPFTTKTGFAIGTDYFINDRFTADFNLVIKPTRKEIRDSDSFSDWFFTSYQEHHELTALFMDMPIHIRYKLFSFKSFSFSLSAGPRLFYVKTSHEMIRTYVNRDPFYYKEERNNLNLGIDMGFDQRFAVTRRLGLFASEHYGQALLGYSNGFESTDLDFGLTFNIK